MKRMRFRTLLLILLAIRTSAPVSGAVLSGQLSPDDIANIVGELAPSGAVRLMRSAERYPKWWPGMKFGVEFDLLFAGGLEKLGNQTGNIPTFIPQPRFYFSKGLFYGFELIFSFFPASIMSTLGSTGGIIKWTFHDERERDLSVAAFSGYTSIAGLSGTFSGSTFEGGVYVSKDYVRLKPYVGMSFLYIHGSVPKSYAATAENSASGIDVHTFLGCEFNLPVSISAQLDLYNFTPRAAVFFGKTL